MSEQREEYTTERKTSPAYWLFWMGQVYEFGSLEALLEFLATLVEAQRPTFTETYRIERVR